MKRFRVHSHVDDLRRSEKHWMNEKIPCTS
jgi:hypothetical protein